MCSRYAPLLRLPAGPMPINLHPPACACSRGAHHLVGASLSHTAFQPCVIAALCRTQVELKSGETYRGELNDAEDNWNCQLKNVTATARVRALLEWLPAGSCEPSRTPTFCT